MVLLPKVDMNVFEAIQARRSIRSYKDDIVDSSTIHSLLENAVQAPTAMHQEPWSFVVIQDKSLLKNLSDHAKPLLIAELQKSTSKTPRHKFDDFMQPDFNIFYNAGTLILICGRSDMPFFEADCWLAAENLMLAACGTGLGSCVIGCALPALKSSEIKAQLRIPNEYSVVAPIILGYADNVVMPTSRKPPTIVASFTSG